MRVVPDMPFSGRVIAMFLSVSVAAAGCRLFFAAPTPIVDPLDVSLLESLRERLNRPLWRQRRVSLIERTETVRDLRLPLLSSQWELADPLLKTLLTKLDEDDLSRPYLMRLAAEKGEVGGNALILLARRHPAEAASLISRLQDIVAEGGSDEENPLTSTGTNGDSAGKMPVSTAAERPDRFSLSASSPGRWERLSLRELIRRVKEQAGQSISSEKGGKNTHSDRSGKETTLEERGKKNTGGKELSPTLRSAAAEVWCRLLLQSPTASADPLEALAPAGRVLMRSHLPEEIRITLWRAVAPYVPSAGIPHLNEVFREGNNAAGNLSGGSSFLSSLRLRRAAMEVCVMRAWQRWKWEEKGQAPSAAGRKPGGKNGSGGELWPPSIRNAAHDADPVVRILFGRWAALTHVPDALDILTAQQRDIDETVQRASLSSLAILGTPEARRRLRQAGEAESVGMRVGAVRALARWGPAELVRFLSDPSPEVRQAVAHSAGHWAEPSSAALLRHLLRDSHLHVQQACVQAVIDWPDELAIPLLLEAMAEAPSAVALPAWHALRERRALPDSFPALADITRRQNAVNRLIREHRLPQRIDEAALPRPALLAEAERIRYRREVDEALQKLQSEPKQSPGHQSALERLKKLDAAALPVLEEWMQQSPGNVPEELFEIILPALHPVYAAVRDLRHRDPLVRQRAAQQLAAWGSQSSLSPVVVQQMTERIGRYSDRIVWQYALRAVMQDATPAAEKLAMRASQLMAPEVRMLACEYFRRHPAPKFAERLLELMNDTTHRGVQLAALRAAGYCHSERLITGDRKPPVGRLDTGEASSPTFSGKPRERSLSQRRLGLVSWAQSSDRELAEAAVVSLARLGHELGYRELHRLSFHPDSRRRKRAYALMAETGKKRFVPHLIRRAAAEQSPPLQTAILAALEKLTPVGERPVGLSRSSRYDERIRVWQQWLEERESKQRPLP